MPLLSSSARSVYPRGQPRAPSAGLAKEFGKGSPETGSKLRLGPVSIFISDDGGSKLLDEIANKEEAKKARQAGRTNVVRLDQETVIETLVVPIPPAGTGPPRSTTNGIRAPAAQRRVTDNNKDNRSSVRCVR